MTRWLTRYVKVPRNKVGAVLHLYPFDYSPAFDQGIRKYVAAQLQAEAAAASAAESESAEEEPPKREGREGPGASGDELGGGLTDEDSGPAAD